MQYTFEHIYFSLLRCAIWDSKPVLPRALSIEEWNSVYSISKEQTVSGIMLDTVSKLHENQKPPKQLLLQWAMLYKRIQNSNIKANSILVELLTELEENGIESYLLKGQGIAQNYPNPLNRICGDIDLYFTPGNFEKAMEYFSSKEEPIEDHSEDSHAETAYKDVKVELHKKSATFYTKRLQKRYNQISDKLILNSQTSVTINDKEIAVLPPLLNALQLLSHMLRHIITSGLGLRQVCDWVLFIDKNLCKIDKEEFITAMKELDLLGTYKAISAISVDYLGLPAEKVVCEITEKDKKVAKKVLNLIMWYGNFGHYGEHSVASSKMEFLKSYIWKVKNCIRFRKLAKSETLNYPIWQLHSIKSVMNK